ncbi:hypothetical protein SUGI_0435870 [Cryptomeria japonica]|uniref:cytochrome c biogenesis protein CCS1, chloroplastic n=1 Tax=Cryptomeria japonica TaxID=3369 RepID=UPI002408DE23|nr:cytochrome c biogenesis protein CCS1, chloroplastic [Cryptomeria japonica]GLJ23088.1 hypothetical protein SUGI_0435870 [Cryptomeria japonica]
MGHCNICQAQRILQDCANISRWTYGNKSLGKHPSQKCGFRIQLLPSGRLRNFTVMARIKEAKNPTKKSKLHSKSLSITSPPEGTSAPALSDVSLSSEDSSGQAEMGFGGLGVLRKLPRKVLKLLSSLPLAIGELSVLSGLLALGTFIEQGESPQFYFEKYPEDSPVYGFLTWRWVLGLCLDHVYTAPYFLGLVVLLAASLMACTTTTQLPMVKVARRWTFMKSGSAILKLEVAESLPRANIQDLGVLLMGSGYEVFFSESVLYGFKGLAGRLAPIGVHAALLLIMAGATLSSIGGYHGSVTVPQGLNFMMGDVLTPNGILSKPIPDFQTEVHVDKFYIDYYENGEVSQFHTDLSLRDTNGKEVLKKTISVNSPLRFGGITIYQTDWSISALQIHKNGAGPFNLAMATLQSGDNKLFGTFLPLEDDNSSTNPKGISILARDLQSVVLYDQEGKFVGVRRPGSNHPISIDGMEVVVDDAIGSTGLELKLDPGVPVVYAGFGALMFTTIVSFFSHSQVWALQEGTSVVVGGKSNRDKLGFQEEMNRIFDSVPEVVGKKHSAGQQSASLENDEISSPMESTLS